MRIAALGLNCSQAHESCSQVQEEEVMSEQWEVDVLHVLLISTNYLG